MIYRELEDKEAAFSMVRTACPKPDALPDCATPRRVLDALWPYGFSGSSATEAGLLRASNGVESRTSGPNVPKKSRNPFAACSAVAFACLALAGCNDAKPIGPASSGNPDVAVALIAQIAGCDLYRVRESGNRVYLSVCRNAASQTRWTEGCGKGCTRTVEALAPSLSAGENGR